MEKPFVCYLCQKAFSLKDQLERHISRVHLKLKPFSCDICLKHFASKHSLESHVDAIHKNIRPFVCSVCQKSYPRKHKLVHHLKKTGHENSGGITSVDDVKVEEGEEDLGI